MVESPELFFAAYDPAIRSIDGRYWVWSSPRISTGLLDDAHKSVTRNDLCETPNSLDAEDLWGGCVGLSQQWCVFYRYYNGGRDLVGRPERAVILFAFVNRKDALLCDGIQLLDEGPFSEWALLQPLPGCPSSPGIDGRITFTPHTLMLPPATVPLLKPAGGSPVKGNTVSDGWEALRSIPINARFLLKVRRNHGVWKKPEFVRLENCSDRVGSDFGRSSHHPANRDANLPLRRSTFRSIDAHRSRSSLKRLVKDYSASLCKLVLCTLLVVLVFGWQWSGVVDHQPNPSSSESRESLPAGDTAGDRDDRRNSRDRTNPRESKELLAPASQQSSVDPESEEVQINKKSPSDHTSKDEPGRDDEAHKTPE